MPFLSPHIQPERILAYGAMGTGKSNCFVNIMQWSARTHSPATFHAIVTDQGLLDVIDDLIGKYPYLSDRFFAYLVYDYPEYIAALDTIRPTLTRHDWLCCDLIGDVWDACQRYFIEQVYGTAKTDYFLAARQGVEAENQRRKAYNEQLAKGQKPDRLVSNLSPMEGWIDWPVINSHNKLFMDRFALTAGCNVFAMTQSDILGDANREAIENINTYERFGVKPHGQKFLGNYFRTVLLCGRDRSNWLLNTVRDRGREELVGAPVKEFSMTYLRDVAGWRF